MPHMKEPDKIPEEEVKGGGGTIYPIKSSR